MATLTYSDANASIFSSDWFKGRVRVATSNYVNYLLNTDAADPDFDAKIQLSTRLTNQYEQVVSQLMFTLSGDAEVQAAGPSIDDPTLQLITEKTLKKFFPVLTVPAGMPLSFGVRSPELPVS